MVTVQVSPTASFLHGPACEDAGVGFTDLSRSNTTGTIVSWQWDFGDPGSGTSNATVARSPGPASRTSSGNAAFPSTTIRMSRPSGRASKP